MKKKVVLFAILYLILSLVLITDYFNNVFGNDFSKTISYPGLWSLSFLPLTLIGFKLNDKKYKFWAGFTVIFFTVSMFIVFSMPETAGGLFLNPDRESTNWFFAGLYSFISLVYFRVQYLKQK